MPWPNLGLVESTGYETQPRNSTVECENVRAWEPSTGRARGGQRAGLTKYVNDRTSANNVQDIGQVVTRSTPSAQTEVGARDVVSYAVTNGTVAKFTTSAFTTATGGSGALSTTTPVIFSAELFGTVYFADGDSTKEYAPGTNTVSTWTPSAGSLPGSGSTRCRLVESWRGRIVLSGLETDPHNWFMSAVGDADDWDYTIDPPTHTMAVAGNNADAGKSPDIINAMCPYNDDILIFFGDHSIWQMTGDPAESGRLDLVSSTIGAPFGRPYCKSPEGIIYFFGSRGGMYMLQPGGQPENISEKQIPERLNSYDADTTLVRMAWSDVEKGVYLFLTPLGGGATTNYFYDVRNNAWWPDKFDTNTLNPISVHLFDGDEAGDRTVLMGGQDGYVRKWDYTTPGTSDDGTAIDSNIMLGPIQLQNRPKMMLTEMMAGIGTGSDDVTFDVYAAETAQAAEAAATAKFSGTFSAGRNKSERRRAIGHDIYVKLSNTTDSEAWTYEFLQIVLNSFDGPRGRQW